jgi:thiamine-monophosphate kinase
VAGLGLGPGREFDLIRGFFAGTAPRSRPDIAVGPGDDCAVVIARGIALSSDMSVENIHFRRDWLSEAEIGYRATAAALSDLAAVAARPIGVLASLALPDRDTDGAANVMQGVRRAAEHVGAALLGGDLSGTEGPLVLDITVVGEAAEPVLRNGARPGDELWVTGELGGAAAAVAQWLRGEAPDEGARQRFAAPEPRTREALWLRERGVLHALIDLSDGLAGDAAHLAAASGVAVILDGDTLPVHPSVARVAATADEALQLAAAGGEDYELAFAAPPGRVDTLAEAFRGEFGIRLTRVGRVEEGEGVVIESRRPSGGAVPLTGFQHFGSDG